MLSAWTPFSPAPVGAEPLAPQDGRGAVRLCDAFRVGPARVGEPAHQHRVAAAGAVRLAVDEHETVVVEHPRAPVERDRRGPAAPAARRERGAWLRLAQRFAERAGAQFAIGK
jgi:hypothetical protein